MVQEVVVELQHTQLGQLICHDAYLEGSVYRDLVFAGFDLVCVADLFEIFKPDRTQMFVDNVFVFCVQHFCLTLNGFDKLAVSTVAQKLVHFCEESFFCFNVTFPSHVGYFLHEPAEDFSGYVVDRAVNGRDFETVLVIPFQKRGVQKYFFISLIRMRSKRDIKMGRLCTPGGAVLGIVGGGVTFRFLNGEAILDENMLFWVRLYALVVVLKILLDFRLKWSKSYGLSEKKRSLWGATSL